VSGFSLFKIKTLLIEISSPGLSQSYLKPYYDNERYMFLRLKQSGGRNTAHNSTQFLYNNVESYNPEKVSS
jgi:hypothetical protein